MTMTLPAPTAEEATDVELAFESARAEAREAILKMARQAGGVSLAEARTTASPNAHANARAIVRLVASGQLTLTDDQRLLPHQ